MQSNGVFGTLEPVRAPFRFVFRECIGAEEAKKRCNVHSGVCIPSCLRLAVVGEGSLRLCEFELCSPTDSGSVGIAIEVPLLRRVIIVLLSIED
jgi:hypothetical protein